MSNKVRAHPFRGEAFQSAGKIVPAQWNSSGLKARATKQGMKRFWRHRER